MAVESILETIIARKRAELRQPVEQLPRRERRIFSLQNALARNGARLIMECKRASPSAGRLRDDVSLASVIDAYSGVADSISVLTDRDFFSGSLDDLAYVSGRVDVPVLRKDFIIDPFQVREAWAYGADAVLLMLSVLDDTEWKACADEAGRHGLDILTEVHDEEELERALRLDANIIGINNRSFSDLSVNIDVTRRLAPLVPKDRLIVCESGIRDHTDIRLLAPMVDAFLVGSSLMRAARIDLAARELAHGQIKICGLTRPEDAIAAYECGARYGGIILSDVSPRYVDLARAHAIVAASPLPMVGVFVNADATYVGHIARDLKLAAVQLHGDEDSAMIEATRNALPQDCELWKAIRAQCSLPVLPENVDRVLFDSLASGTRFDWSILPVGMPSFGLAGGINADNITTAIATGAGLLDVNSSVESAPGVKARKKMFELFEAIRIAVQQRVTSKEKTDEIA